MDDIIVAAIFVLAIAVSGMVGAALEGASIVNDCEKLKGSIVMKDVITCEVKK